MSLFSQAARSCALCALVSTTRVLLAAEQSSQISPMDKEWAHMAAVSDKMEIELAKLADRTTETASVKEQAQQMIRDHSKTSDQLMQWAKANNVDLEAELPPMKAAALQEVASKKGVDFDTMYLNSQVKVHRMAAAHFQNGVDFLMNPALREFARTFQPAINMHLTMAENATGLAHSVTADGRRVDQMGSPTSVNANIGQPAANGVAPSGATMNPTAPAAPGQPGAASAQGGSTAP